MVKYLISSNVISFSSELELPNRDKTHINMSLEVLDILKVIILLDVDERF